MPGKRSSQAFIYVLKSYPAQVGMTQAARDGAQICAPKIYGYYDNVPNPINAEVVLLEMVLLFLPLYPL